jgi:hypothetical protein
MSPASATKAAVSATTSKARRSGSSRKRGRPVFLVGHRHRWVLAFARSRRRCAGLRIRMSAFTNAPARDRGFAGAALPRRNKRNCASIVCEQPAWIDGLPQPGVRCRNVPHLAHARHSIRRIPCKAVAGMLRPDVGDAAGEHSRVFDGHGSAGRHIGAHRVAGIAKKDNSSLMPPLDWLTLEYRPFRDLRSDLDDRSQFRVIAVKHREKLVTIASNEGRRLLPMLLECARDDCAGLYRRVLSRFQGAA